MLFLLRPRQTWMPFVTPRNLTQQGAYNRSLQERYQSTCRTPAPSPSPDDPVARLNDLAALRESGALSEAEFAAAKRQILDPDEGQ
jgi:hypothetical protein